MNASSDVIPAANDLNIQLDTNSWRLFSTELETPTMLVEATPEGLMIHPVFVEARGLPGAMLSPKQVSRVVLGWAPENQAWRLGMLLQDANATALDTTALQWCELAAWPDDAYAGRVSQAKLAAQDLARLLGRPFQLIEPDTKHRLMVLRGDTQPPVSLQTETPSPTREATTSLPESSSLAGLTKEDQTAPLQKTPDITPLDLPIHIGDWLLVRHAAGLRWRRTQVWWTANFARLVLFSVLCVLFLILSIGTQVSGFAAVEPEWLPMMGLMVGFLLLLNLGQTVWQVFTSGAVVIDTFQREIYNRGLLLPFVNWRVPFDNIEYLLITQSTPRPQGRRRHDDPMRIAQDVWLHIFDGEHFYQVVDLETVEGKSWDWDLVRQHSRAYVRRHLQLALYDTPAHHAAMRIAAQIGVPTYIDLS